MKRLVVLVAGVVILLSVPLSGISDTNTSVANPTILAPDTSGVPPKAESSDSNSSATATITITMTTAPNE